MEHHGNTWKIMENCGDSWKLMVKYGESFKFMEKAWKTHTKKTWKINNVVICADHTDDMECWKLRTRSNSFFFPILGHSKSFELESEWLVYAWW